jgi:hypothetical protein
MQPVADDMTFDDFNEMAIQFGYLRGRDDIRHCHLLSIY